MTSRPRAMFLLQPEAFETIYGAEVAEEIAAECDVIGPALAATAVTADLAVLGDVEVIFSGWGMARADAAFLAAAPKLRAIFYGAGTVGYFATPELFARGVVVSSAATMNAVPVSEYTLATILFSLKHGWQFVRRLKTRDAPPKGQYAPGNYRSTVGLVSLGAIARLVCGHLRHFDLNVIAYDPYLSDADAAALGVTRVSLAELFARSDAVSLHTPDLPTTRGMIGRELLASMKPGATFINTARGAVVDEPALIDVLTARPDLQAVLDVTHPEPPAPDSPLHTMANVVLTPHIAGSIGPECRRMGRFMLDEFRRWRAGEPMRGQVTLENSMHSAHGLKKSE